MADEQAAATTQEAPQQGFDIQRIYLKDLSFEAPNSPMVFTQQVQLETGVELNTSSRKIADNLFEVELVVTVTAKAEDKTAYLVEVKQAGVFAAVGYSEEQMAHLLGSYCPNILYPFIREVVSDQTTKGGFPPMLLSPINFDALFAQHMQERQEKAEQPSSDTEH